jgi:membrane protein
MAPITSLRILRRACEQWSANGDSRLGAALAYYTLFSVAPLLLIAMQIAGAVFGEDAAKGKVKDQLVAMMGPEIAAAVEKMVENAAEPHTTTWASIVSIVLLVVAALGAFLHVRTALCMIWKLEPPHGNSWLGILMDYGLALLMVFLIAVLLLISLAFSLAVPIMQRLMQAGHLDVAQHWQWVELVGSFLFLTILFATSYRILSGGRVPWGYVWYASIIASILFTIGKTLLSYYLVYTGTASMYGAAGSVVVFMMWVYYSSQILFFGAELVQARRTRFEWMNAKPSEPEA